jgi:predicted component of type VI protein secretion system
MANIFTNKLNDREFLDAFGVESPMTPEELAALSQEQEVVSEPVVSPVQNIPKPTPKPTPKATTSTNPPMEGVPSIDKIVANLPKQDSQSTPTETPLTKSEQLIAEYQKMLGRDQEELSSSRQRDRMLKVGGALYNYGTISGTGIIE